MAPTDGLRLFVIRRGRVGDIPGEETLVGTRIIHHVSSVARCFFRVEKYCILGDGTAQLSHKFLS